MIRLDLNEEERTVVAEALAGIVADLRMEISNTDLVSFRDPLKRKEVVLKELLARLKAADR